MASSGVSEDIDPDGVNFRGESVLLCDRVALSARPEEFEEAEECWGVDCGGWRAPLEERLAASIAEGIRLESTVTPYRTGTRTGMVCGLQLLCRKGRFRGTVLYCTVGGSVRGLSVLTGERWNSKL